MQTVRDRNAAKIEELLPKVRWAAIAWERDCWKEDEPIEILEAYRTPERQRFLWEMGRDKEGNVVNPKKIKTLTLSSNHTKRLALDVRKYGAKEDAAFFSHIEEIAKRYRITHPLTSGQFIDLWHFEFDKVGIAPAQPNGDTMIAKNATKRAHERLLTKLKIMTPEVAKRAIKRIQRIFS